MTERGEQFGRFILHERLGGGAMAEVYRAFMTGPMGFRKEVALKRIRPDIDDPTQRSNFLRSLTNEARMGAYLKHRNIVEVYDFGQVEDTFFVAMEYVRGVTLAQLIDGLPAGSVIPARVVCHIATQLFEGLQAAHTAEDDVGQPLRLVHRDLKPANVMLDQHGTVKIADFGIARATTNLSKTDTGTTKGTPTFMSPEQVLGKELDHRSDQFAAGALLATLITGHAAFEGEQLYEVLHAIAEAKTAGLFAEVGSRAPELDPVVRRCMEREPGRRYRDAEEAGRAITRVLERNPGDEQLAPWLAEHRPARPAIEVRDSPSSDEPPVSGTPAGESPGGVGTRSRGWMVALGAGSAGIALAAGLAVALVAGVALMVALSQRGDEDEWTRAWTEASGDVEWVHLEGGAFSMGRDDGPAIEAPRHKVWVEPLWMSHTEVTVAQFARCVDAGACREPDSGEDCTWRQPQALDHPVNCVDWAQAQEYALWAGARLPTEAEWEYAARNGGQDQLYPWGNDPPVCTRIATPSCGVEGTQPVCTLPGGNTEQGLCDMVGGVSEWVEDNFHDGYRGAPANGSAWTTHPLDPRVVRGASWRSDPDLIRATSRNYTLPSVQEANLGFRIVKPVSAR